MTSTFFVWENRTDNFIKYKAGSQYRPHPKRLVRIDTAVDGIRVSQYKMTYEEVGVDNRSRLTRIEQCDDAGLCKKPLEFAWWHDGNTEYQLTRMAVPFFDTGLDDTNTNPPPQFAYTTPRWHDLNGDGTPDYVHHVPLPQGGYSNTTATFEILMSSSSGYQQVTWTTSVAGSPLAYHWADINGDGRTDIMLKQNGVYKIALATADGFVEPNWTLPSGFNPFYLIDMNGDSLLDLAIQESHCTFIPGIGSRCTYTYKVSLNTGAGFASESTWADDLQGHYVLQDMNGDGLADLLKNDRYAYFNNGAGFAATAHDFGSAGYRVSPYMWMSTYRDYNGDGLADRHTRITGNPSQYKLEYNTGKAFVLAKTNVRATSGLDIEANGFGDTYIRNVVGTYGYYTYASLHFTSDEQGTEGASTRLIDNEIGIDKFQQMTDLNGDGVMEYTIAETHVCQKFVNHLGYWVKRFCETGQLRVYESQSGHLHRLKSITTGTGAQTLFTYKAITDHSIYSKRNDGVLPVVDVQNSQTHVVTELKRSNGLGGFWRTTYTYEGLKHDTGGRGYLGFARITARNHQDQTITTTDYAQQFPLVAEPIAIEVKRASDQQLVSRSDLSYSLLGEVGNQPVFPWLSERIDKVYSPDDGSLLSTTTTTTQVDSFGSVTEQSTEVVDHGTGDATRTRTINTLSNDISSWRIGQLDQQQQQFYKNGVRDSSLDRVTHYSYDPATGLLTKTHQEPGSGAGLELVTEQSYDSFGNLISQSISGPGLQARSSTIAFDVRGQFPLTLTNALGHTVSRTWDARFGNKLSETDSNGQTTHWVYNDFGQLVSETRPDGTQTSTLFYEDTSLPNAAYVRVSVETGKGPGRQWYDRLHRPLRTEAVGFTGSRIWQDTEYDHYGRTLRQSAPYFQGDSPVYTSTSYDERSRITAINAADPAQSQTFSYNGLAITTTDAAGRSTVKTSNALGQVVEVVDAQNTVMQLRYDAAGNRVRVTNAVGTAQENSVTYEYDKLGRLLAQNDPDHGIYRYSYDALGQKLTEVSPKMAAAGTHLSWQYDVLGRVTRRTDSDGVTSWAYDNVTGGALGVGKLDTEQTAGFSRSYRYAPGDYGRLSGTSIRIDTTVYESGITYNGNGQIATQSYPAQAGAAAFTVAYRYNAAGYLERVQSTDGASVYYQLLDTDAAGRMSLRWLGDGSVKSQSYDGVSPRIAHQHTSAASGDTVQQFSYSYDDMGNMTERQDNLHQIAEQFSFDHLDRLTQAQVVGATAINFGFDKLGNMTEKSDLASAYQYTTSALHAVTQLQNAGASEHIDYDVNGNLTDGDDLPTVTWTSYNKPSKIQKGEISYDFYYGSDHKRYKKKRNSLVTHYLGDSTEIIRRATPEIRYTLKANGVAFMIRRERGGIVKHHYLHRDHLGSITAVTDETDGSIVERYSYDAWGKRRIATNWQAGEVITTLNYRGYTGHEHLDDVGIIHMNGRLYSPKLGRMLSPDPVTQAPENGQNYNRYSYANNNPMKFTDPTGYAYIYCVDGGSDLSTCLKGAISEMIVVGTRSNYNELFFLTTDNYWRESGLGQGGGQSEQREEQPQNTAGDDGKRNDVEPSEENPLGLSPEDARKALEYFYPENELPDIENMSEDWIQFANELIEQGAIIQSVTDIMMNFSPGSPVKPNIIQIATRVARNGLRDGIQTFIGNLTFEEKLESLGGAAKHGAANNLRRKYDMLIGGI